jgi:hypothetical protein
VLFKNIKLPRIDSHHLARFEKSSGNPDASIIQAIASAGVTGSYLRKG